MITKPYIIMIMNKYTVLPKDIQKNIINGHFLVIMK